MTSPGSECRAIIFDLPALRSISLAQKKSGTGNRRRLKNRHCGGQGGTIGLLPGILMKAMSVPAKEISRALSDQFITRKTPRKKMWGWRSFDAIGIISPISLIAQRRPNA